MRCAVVAVAVAVVASAAPRAEACSCVASGLAIPADGATGVPTNLARISAVEVGELSLVNLTTSVAVPLIADGKFATVVGLLDPDTRYVVGSTHTGVVTFTTGAGPDLVPPPAPTLTGFGATDLDPDQTTSCAKPTYRLHGDLEAAEPGTVTLLAGEGAVILTTDDLDLAQISDSTCNPHKLSLRAGTTYDLELVAHDYAGNASEHTHVTLDMPDGCAAGGRGSLGGALLVAAVIGRRRSRRPSGGVSSATCGRSSESRSSRRSPSVA